MTIHFRLISCVCIGLCLAGVVVAQDLALRAYFIAPTHSNTIVLTHSHFSGRMEFDGAVPITRATSKISLPVFSYYRAMNFLAGPPILFSCCPTELGICKERFLVQKNMPTVQDR